MIRLLASSMLFMCVFGFSQGVKEKLGIIFKIDGPYKVNRNYIIYGLQKNTSPNDDYSEVFNFLKKENPIQRIENFYTEKLNNRYQLVLINEDLSEENFPLFQPKKNRYYRLDITKIKTKYDVEKVLIVDGIYGLEFENIAMLSGDKRTTVSLNNYIVNTVNNEIIEKFQVSDIKNIRKKGLINPPHYPNVEESMNRLLLERIFPRIEINLEKK